MLRFLKTSELESDSFDDCSIIEKQESACYIEKLFDILPYPVFIVNACNCEILSSNSAGEKMAEGITPFCHSIFHGKKSKCEGRNHDCPIDEAKRTKKPYNTDIVIANQNNPTAIFDVTCLPMTDDDGEINSVVLIAHDITRHKMFEKAHNITNDILRRERLSLKRTNLMQQAQAARYERDKQLVQKQVQSNIDNIAMPALNALESRLDDDAMEYLNSIKKVLAEICSPYINKLESEYPGLTPREIETCNLIKHGLSSMDIASTMGLSPQTVHIRRKTIRRKLGLTRKRINLQRFLQNI